MGVVGTVVVVVVVLLVAGDVVSVEAQEAFFDNYAFTKVMSECLGASVYQDYLQKVSEARRACGGVGGLDIPRGTSILSSVLPPSAFPQGVPIQPGGLFLQQPGILLQQRPASTAFFPHQQQQPAIFSRHPAVFTHQPQQPQPSVFSRQPTPTTILTSQPGNIFHQPRGGIFGSQSQPGSVFTPPTHVFTSDPNDIFTTTSEEPTLTLNNEGGADPFVFRSPLGPPLPGVREKRAIVLGSAEVEVAKVKMESLLGNLTCVLKTLAVVDENLNINHERIASNTVNLPVNQFLKQDLLTALQYCRDTAVCLPVERLGSPVTPQLQRLMAYVKCEKAMRLSACLKHDLRTTLDQMGVLGVGVGGSRMAEIERLVSYLVGAESANELELI